MSQKILVIVGPTAVGKTEMSLLLAERFEGEVISADSMQVYKGLDIGTAKASAQQRNRIRHQLIDIADYRDEYTLADFLRDCNVAVTDILSRGKLPIIVGGTGLYVSSFTENIQLHEEQTDPGYRAELILLAEKHGNRILMEMLQKVDPESSERLHENDRKRLIRALEIYHVTGKTQTWHNAQSKIKKSPYLFYKAGLNFQNRELLYKRIENRVDKMMESGFLEEVRGLEISEISHTAVQAIGYRQLFSVLKNEISLQEAVAQIKLESRRYAKRQLTWFRRDPEICWRNVDEASLEENLEYFETSIEKFLKV